LYLDPGENDIAGDGLLDTKCVTPPRTEDSFTSLATPASADRNLEIPECGGTFDSVARPFNLRRIGCEFLSYLDITLLGKIYSLKPSRLADCPTLVQIDHKRSQDAKVLKAPESSEVLRLSNLMLPNLAINRRTPSSQLSMLTAHENTTLCESKNVFEKRSTSHHGRIGTTFVQ
jgi:hypothetical protein